MLVYLDDILVFSSTFAHHTHLELVAKLKEHNLIAKPTKTHLFQQLQYLGFQIGDSGEVTIISPSPKIVNVLDAGPCLRNYKQHRRF